MDMIQITYEQFNRMTEDLIARIDQSGLEFDSIHGVPRGGVPLAIALGFHYNKPVLKEPNGGLTLVVDDIADSGRTIAKYKDKYPTATLYKHKRCKTPPDLFVDENTQWIEFPWEAGEAAAEDAVVRIIEAIGDDPTREGLQDTPKRVVKSWKELFSGYDKKAEDILSVTFEDGMDKCDEIVLCKDIEFYSTCEHHMLPIIGKAHVAYIPDKKVVGLSKLARLLDMYARRLQIQEKMTNDVATALMTHLKPKGVGVIVEAKHFCMCARGVNKQNSWMTTSSMTGAFREKPEARAELLQLCGY